ncbi:MAG: hypothetical protein HOC71_04880 [Candidatus Latescibacteria bacterium]|jgi:hypothetical protein|nr:hypothetical protein [Candidatus Latescibacterota bacterium]
MAIQSMNANFHNYKKNISRYFSKYGKKPAIMMTVCLTFLLIFSSFSFHCSKTHHHTGIDTFAEMKSELWESPDTDWVKWVVVNGTCSLHSDEARRRFIEEFDPDIIDWYYGPGMNPCDLCRKRGIAVSGPEEYEYQEALQFSRDYTRKIFKENGISLTEDGEIAFYHDFGGGEFMCHNAPRWHQVIQQGLVRLAPYGDSVTQDNIASPLQKGWGTFCKWCNSRFIEYMQDRFSPADLNKMGFDPKKFNIQAYMKKKRTELTPEKLIEEPILHEYIRFQYRAHIIHWIDLVEKTKRAAVKYGRPVPALYGNQWGAQGIWPLGPMLSPHVDVVWIEQALYQPYVETGEFDTQQPFAADKDKQAWSTLAYKLGRATGYFKKPVWTVKYPENHLLTSIVLAEARANGGQMVQCYRMNEEHVDGYVWNAHRTHARFASNNRVLFLDRDSKSDVALIYSIAGMVWRNFSSLTVPSSETWDIMKTCDHVKQFTLAARLLEDNHIPYDALVFGHPDFYDDTPSFKRLSRYKTVILPMLDAISDRQAEYLREWVRNGGQLILWGDTGTRDEELRIRSHSVFKDLQNNPGNGSVISVKNEENALAFLNSNKQPLIETDLPRSVWLNVWQHGNGPMTSVQMVNYNADIKANEINSVQDFTLRLRCDNDEPFTDVRFLSPDSEPLNLPFTMNNGYAEVKIPNLNIFGVIVFSAQDEFRARSAAAQVRKWLERLKIANRCPGETIAQDSELIRETEAALNTFQGSANDDYNSSMRKSFDSMTMQLKSRVEQITENVSILCEELRSDTADINAQYKFDFGEKGVHSNWLEVRKSTAYTKSKGYGWIEHENIRDENAETLSTPFNYADDCLYSEHPAEFQIDLEKGDYTVTIITGDNKNDIHVGTTYVNANDEPVLIGNRLFRGYFQNRAFQTHITDGKLVLRFYGNNIGPLYYNPLEKWESERNYNGTAWLVNGVIIQRIDQAATEIVKTSLKQNQLIRQTALRDWAVIGPFDDKDWNGLNKLYPPEISADLSRSHSGKKDLLQWKLFSPSETGLPFIRLSELTDDIYGSAAFLLTHVYSNRQTTALLSASTSQTGKGYVNGEVVFQDETAAGLLVDEEKVRITLKKGWNSILIKSYNFWGPEWSVYAALMSEDGKPLRDIKVSATGNQMVSLSHITGGK